MEKGLLLYKQDKKRGFLKGLSDPVQLSLYKQASVVQLGFGREEQCPK